MFLLLNSAARRGRTIGVDLLRGGSDPVLVLEAALREAESDPTESSVGLSAIPNVLGQVELDASVMEGSTRRSGSVAALKGFLHPVSVARQVMERLPHVLLVGEGAARFAREIGAEEAELLTPPREAEWRVWLASNLAQVRGAPRTTGPAGMVAGTGVRTEAAPGGDPEEPLIELVWRATGAGEQRDTAIALASNDADLASGTSTSGWPYKYPGRLGDSAVVGAGHYADSRWGAAACTHTGEMTIRAGTARAVVRAMQSGMTPEEACREAVVDLRALRGGFLSEVVVYAVDAKGNHYAATTGVAGAYWWWETGMAEPEERRALPV